MSVIKHITKRIRPNSWSSVVYYEDEKNVISVVDLNIFVDGESTRTTRVSVYVVNTLRGDNVNIGVNDNKFCVLYKKEIKNNEAIEVPKLLLEYGQRVVVTFERETNLPINVRVSGIKQTKPVSVLKHGLLNGIYAFTDNSVQEIYRLDTPLAIYSSGNLTIVNNTIRDCTVSVWITDSEGMGIKPTDDDSINLLGRYILKPNETRVIEDIIMAPNEIMYCNSTNGKYTGVTYNGVVMSGKID